jgi:hypothetical protein
MATLKYDTVRICCISVLPECADKHVRSSLVWFSDGDQLSEHISYLPKIHESR